MPNAGCWKTPCAWCSWNFNSTNGTINPAYMTQVANVVDWALADGMYVIINDHWDGGWVERDSFNTYSNALNSNLINIWTQVANHFKNYDSNKLAFACANAGSIRTTSPRREPSRGARAAPSRSKPAATLPMLAGAKTLTAALNGPA